MRLEDIYLQLKDVKILFPIKSCKKWSQGPVSLFRYIFKHDHSLMEHYLWIVNKGKVTRYTWLDDKLNAVFINLKPVNCVTLSTLYD